MIIYSRFSLHVIGSKGEDSLLNWIFNSLNKDGYFFLEARSDKDDMLNKGSKISNNENITDHYRRYLNFEDIKSKIKNLGLIIIEAVEQDNLSVVGEDNPMLIRIIAKKQ